MIIRRLFAIGLTCVAFAAYAAHSPSVLAAPEPKGRRPMVQSRLFSQRAQQKVGGECMILSGILKEFKLQAHPEACIGTSESIEETGRGRRFDG